MSIVLTLAYFARPRGALREAVCDGWPAACDDSEICNASIVSASNIPEPGPSLRSVATTLIAARQTARGDC